MLEFLIFGGFWFWLIVSIDLLILIISAFNDAHGLTWIFGIILIFVLFVSGIISWSWVVANPLLFLVCVGIYIFVGIVWSIKEWYDYCLQEAKSNYRWVNTHVEDGSYAPEISQHWDDVTTWIVYFPIFMLAWVLTEPIKKIAKQFSFIYNFVSKKVSDKVRKDLQKNGTKN